MTDTSFKEFSNQMEKATNGINLKVAVGTKRKGKAKFIDRLVFAKYAWSESLSYFAVVQTAMIFFGLIDRVVENINAGFLDLGQFIGITNPYQFPVNIASYVAIMFVVFIFIFGIIAVRNLGTTRRGAEIGQKLSPNGYLIWQKIERIEGMLNKMDIYGGDEYVCKDEFVNKMFKKEEKNK